VEPVQPTADKGFYMADKDDTTVNTGAPRGNGAAAEAATPEGTGNKPRILSDAANRALAEADERRRLREEAAKDAPVELGGRSGPDPVRYGDWEKDGIISDF
jgi:hypothetical protein